MSTSSTSSTSSSNASNGSSHSARRYSRFGIGGAGNYQLTENLSRSPSRPIVARVTGNFRVGIGGAGNTRSHEERAVAISDQEVREMNNLRKKNAPANRHYGIGGAGNTMVRSSPIDLNASNLSNADWMRKKVSAIFS
jgi:hypothetical protein